MVTMARVSDGGKCHRIFETAHLLSLDVLATLRIRLEFKRLRGLAGGIGRITALSPFLV
jgi:hypothetical protein